MSKIIHDRKKCNGCGICSALCPSMFEISDDGLANLKNSKEVNGVFELETDDTESAQEASDLCEAKVIKIEN